MKSLLITLVAFWQICYAGDIQIINHDDTQMYWLAMFVTGSCKAITKVQIKDSGSYSSWYKYTATDAESGFWAFDNNGNGFTLPISVRLTFDDGSRKAFTQSSKQITTFDALTIDTNWSPPCNPTQDPTTAQPTPPTAQPTTASPTTPAPTSEGQECHSADASNFVWSSVGPYIYLNGKKVTFKGAAWFGFETTRYLVDGLGSASASNGGHSYKWYFDFLELHGFTAIRLPFSQDMIDINPTPSAAQYDASGNSIFSGKSALECMDVIIEEAADRGILIMLDFHSKNAGSWTDGLNSLISWSSARAAWRVLANRYSSQWNIFMADIYNEPHDVSNSEWSTWIDFVEYIAQDLIANYNVNWLMAVQGTNWDCGGSVSCWWGENLINAVNDYPNLSSKRVVWSPHVYGPDLGYKAYSFQVWNDHWGYIVHDNTIDGAIVIGEFGTRYNNNDKKDWLDTFVAYLISIDQRSTFFWCLNANSGDTGGLLADDWTSVQSNDKMLKLDELNPSPTLFDVNGNTICWEGGDAGGDDNGGGTYTLAPTSVTDAPTPAPTIEISGDDILVWSWNGVSEWWFALGMSTADKAKVKAVSVQGSNYGDTWSNCYYAYWDNTDVFACDTVDGNTFSLPLSVRIISQNDDVQTSSDVIDSWDGGASYSLQGFSTKKNKDKKNGDNDDDDDLGMAEIFVIVIVILVVIAFCIVGGCYYYKKKYKGGKGRYDLNKVASKSRTSQGSNKTLKSDDDLIEMNNDDGRRTPTDSADRILRAAQTNDNNAAIVVAMDANKYNDRTDTHAHTHAVVSRDSDEN